MDKKFCIFDMDGTLTDSMRFWKNLGLHYLRAHGVQPDERLLWMVQTMTMHEAARHFMEAFGVPGPEETIISEMNGIMQKHYQNDIPLKPGVESCLRNFQKHGVHMCVATATATPLATACLGRLGVLDCFDFLTSCEDIGRSKEQPDLFLRAAERFQAPPTAIAVFEDSLYAARTAHAAGFYTVGVYEESLSRDWPALAALVDETILDWRDFA